MVVMMVYYGEKGANDAHGPRDGKNDRVSNDGGGNV